MIVKFIKDHVLIVSLLLVTIFLIGVYFHSIFERAHILEIYVFDLKSGYALFVRTPNDKRILINGGSNSEIIRNITKILPFYSRRIDSIILTDDQDKNITGLIDIVERYHVSNAYFSSVNLRSLNLSTTTSRIYEVLLHELKSNKIYTQELVQNDIFKIDDEVIINTLFPAPVDDFKYSKASAPELVLKISYHDNSFLLLGNVSKKIQKYLIASSTSSDVLIIPHSISSSNTSDEFLDSIGAGNTIYSQAKNGILRGGFNIKQIGSVRIASDGNKVDIGKFAR